MRLQKTEIVKYIGYSLLIFLYAGCQDREKSRFFVEKKQTILPIHDTKYKYNNFNIYEIGVNNPIVYTNFLNSGYFSVYDNKIYNIFLDKGCTEAYKTRQYKIEPNLKLNDSLHNPICDIFFSEYFRTDLKIGDTLDYSALGLDRIVMQTKFYDEALKDSIYIFEKMSSDKKSTGFAFTYAHGFIGLYSVFHKIDNIVVKNNPVIAIRDAYGKIYEDTLKRIYPEAGITYIDSIHPEFINLDLSVIKEFTKN